MPLFTLICPRCADNTEIIAGCNEPLDTVYDCDRCGAGLCRRDNRNYTADVPMIQGDTVPGGMNYNYFDPSLGEQVKSRQHREDLMEKKGLQPFEANPVMENARDNAGNILKNAPPNDKEARVAARKEIKEADRKVRRKRLEKAWDKVTPEIMN